MSILHTPSIPMYRNPLLRPGLAALVEWLEDSEYSSHAIGRITRYTAVNGTPSLCPELASEDEAAANAVFADALDAVPYASPAWGDDPEPPDAPDAGMSRSAALGEVIRNGRVEAPAGWALELDGDFWVRPIAGGSPEPEEWAQACEAFRQPYQPTAEDLAEMDAWCARIDAFDAERRAEDARNPMNGYE